MHHLVDSSSSKTVNCYVELISFEFLSPRQSIAAKIYKKLEKSVARILGESKQKFTLLAGGWIKSMRLIFKSEMLINQLKANSDEKIFFGKITHDLYPKVKKRLVHGKFGNKDSILHSGP